MKKHICVLTAAFLGLSVLLGGCGGQTGGAESSQAQTSAQAQEESQQQESGANDSGESQASEAAQTDGQSQADSTGETEAADPNAIRVGSLNGPTSMGLAKLMDEQAGGEASQPEKPMSWLEKLQTAIWTSPFCPPMWPASFIPKHRAM